MANIKDRLKECESIYEERIEAIVVGEHDNIPGKLGSHPSADENVVLSREDGLKKLDEDYDSSYGRADCFPMFAWTKSRVFFISEYDGSTTICWVPRNPIAIEPDFSGNHAFVL